MKPQSSGQLLGIRQAARERGLPYDTVYRMIKTGALPAVQFPGIRRIYVDLVDLDRLIERCKETATA